jgi:hypothetical protein
VVRVLQGLEERLARVAFRHPPVIPVRQRAITQLHGPGITWPTRTQVATPKLLSQRADSRLACEHEADCRLFGQNDLESTGTTGF